MKKDIVAKEIINTITKDIAKYILKLDIDDIELIDKEVQRVERREADIVAKCKIDSKEAILHIEIQNNNDKTMPYRMIRYYIDIFQRYNFLPLYQFVIYIGKEKLNMKDSINTHRLNYSYSLIDMKKIDCEELLKIDLPDALVLAILCDFKNKKELDIITYIIKRLRELVNDNEDRLGKYMIILETLSQNRDLKDKIKEVENMLRDIDITKLPSYELGIEKGIKDGLEIGIEKGIEKGKLTTAIIMIDKYGLSIKEVSKDLGIPIEELKKSLKS